MHCRSRSRSGTNSRPITPSVDAHLPSICLLWELGENHCRQHYYCAANNARYTPHPIPTRLPTTVLCSTGMNKCCTRLTAGHSLYPAFMTGHICYRTAVSSCKRPQKRSTPRTCFTAIQHSSKGTPLNALLPPMYATTLTTAAIV